MGKYSKELLYDDMWGRSIDNTLYIAIDESGEIVGKNKDKRACIKTAEKLSGIKNFNLYKQI